MKTKIILLIVISSLTFSCEKDPCDEGYKPYESNGQTICIPEYLNGKRFDFKLGNMYYHDEYGVITIQNGTWKDRNNVKIENIDN
jgi:hypothetical protein